MTDLRDIVRQVGGSLYAGGTQATVPGPGHSRDDRSLSLSMIGDRIVWKSWANDASEAVWRHLGIKAQPESELSKSERAKIQRDRQEFERAERFRKQEFCRDLWAKSVPATGTPAHAYLRGRNISAATIPGALRYLAQTPKGYKRQEPRPAMLALVSDRYGTPSGLHITYLGKDGHDGRIMVGSIMGGAVRLYESTDELAICEGVETALSYASLKSLPTWAVLSTSGLSNFIPPTEIDRLTLAIDSDDMSKAHPRGAALEIAETRIFPWCVITLDPAPDAMDWNDVLRATS